MGSSLLDIGCYCVNWINEVLDGEITVEKVYANIRNKIDLYADANLKINEKKQNV